MTPASDRPVDAARIREASEMLRRAADDQRSQASDLEAKMGHGYGWQFQAGAEEYDRTAASLDALLRDLDAQGPAPAGWSAPEAVVREIWDSATNSVCQEMQERDMCNCADGNCLATGIMPWEPYVRRMSAAFAPAAPSPALHAPTVEAWRELLLSAKILQANCEACIAQHHGADRDGLPGWLADTKHDIERADALLTSGAEAGERDRAGAAVMDRKGASGNSDRGASARPLLDICSGYKQRIPVEWTYCAWCGSQAREDIGDGLGPINVNQTRDDIKTASAHPLSEWSDDELFRAIGVQWWLSPHAGEQVDELRSRGWLPWHGGDKAPVEGFVQVRFRDGHISGELFAALTRWTHNEPGYNPDVDVVAYRPIAQEGGDQPRSIQTKCNEAPGSTPGAEPAGDFICARCQTPVFCRDKGECYYGQPPRMRPAPAADVGKMVGEVVSYSWEELLALGTAAARDMRPAPAADAGEVERLREAAFRVCESEGAPRCADKEPCKGCMVRAQAALATLGALRAPSEADVERAAARGLRSYEGGLLTNWESRPEPEKQHWRRVARAILATAQPEARP